MSASAVARFTRKMAYLGVGGAIIAAGALTIAPAAGAATSAETAAATGTLNLLNHERAANGLAGLKMSTALISSAHRHNLTMAKANTLSHQLPGEPVFSTRISQAGVNWHSAAENIGYTTDKTTGGSEALETAMYNEVAPNDGHRVNILSTSVHYIGIDVYIDAATGKLWLTEDFADVPGPTTQAAVLPTAHNPVGHLDRAAVLAGHKLQLSGWAYDPDATSTPLRVDVYSDGKIVGHFRNATTRTDVANAKHVGAHQGWTATFVLPAGRHTIAVYVMNVGAGKNVKIATKVYAV